MPKFEKADDAMHWIHSNIKYVYSMKTIKGAQTPEETLRLRTGNCVDMSILLLAIIKYSGLVSYDMRLVGLKNDENSWHVLVAFCYRYYDCTDDEASYSLPDGYYEVPLYATN